MGKGSEYTFSRRHTNGQQVHETVLSITNHQGIQIKITMRYDFHLLEWLLSKRQEITSAGEDGEKKELLCTAMWEYKLVQPPMEIVEKFLKKLKNELPNDSAIPLLGIYTK